MGPPHRGGPATRRFERPAHHRPVAGNRSALGRRGDPWDVRGPIGKGEAGRGGGRQGPKGVGRAAPEGRRCQLVGCRAPSGARDGAGPQAEGRGQVCGATAEGELGCRSDHLAT